MHFSMEFRCSTAEVTMNTRKKTFESNPWFIDIKEETWEGGGIV